MDTRKGEEVLYSFVGTVEELKTDLIPAFQRKSEGTE